jgi:hypothetical protein
MRPLHHRGAGAVALVVVVVVVAAVGAAPLAHATRVVNLVIFGATAPGPQHPCERCHELGRSASRCPAPGPKLDVS